METRIRMALWAAGLPPPTLQFAVAAGGKMRRLDLAYPEVRLAVEYDGEDHRTQERARLDLEREAALVALGWTILRFDARLVHRRPDLVARAVASALRRRGLLVA
jgi:very-short-patch-repair endonuclease